jgi:hypothetical protein
MKVTKWRAQRDVKVTDDAGNSCSVAERCWLHGGGKLQ